jgi:hypothetical protein
MNMKLVIGGLSFLFVVVFIPTVLAQPVDPFTLTPSDKPPVVFQNYTGAISIVARIASWLLYLVIALAVIFIIYAGFLYLTSGGDEKKTKAAKDYILFAVVGIVIALTARGIVMLIQTLIR